jgi:hypothetical protein
MSRDDLVSVRYMVDDVEAADRPALACRFAGLDRGSRAYGAADPSRGGGSSRRAGISRAPRARDPGLRRSVPEGSSDSRSPPRGVAEPGRDRDAVRFLGGGPSLRASVPPTSFSRAHAKPGTHPLGEAMMVGARPARFRVPTNVFGAHAHARAGMHSSGI